MGMQIYRNRKGHKENIKIKKKDENGREAEKIK